MQKPTSGDSKYFLVNIFRHDFIVFCSVYVVHLCVPACRNCKYIVKFSLHIYSVLAQLQFGQCSEMLFTPFKNRVSMQHTQTEHSVISVYNRQCQTAHNGKEKIIKNNCVKNQK